MKYNISIKNQKFEIEIGEIHQGLAKVKVNGVDYDVRFENREEGKARPQTPSKPVAHAAPSVQPLPGAAAPQPSPNADPGNIIKAPIPGLVLDVKVKVGDPVTAGQTVIIMEAMKMENRITATVSGTVKEIFVQKGSEVMTGMTLMIIE